ncbi:DsbA family protein [Vibrio sp. 10N.261.55.A7]|uniref:DsbA family protein n=1 Tax=Vibrio sp. 10N.261.55.A7 TaxID=1880851 RepID=UPI000C838C1F|nr:DsbA family protein [Vibrio sp. 10N.261.55.A7]PMJ92638.1 protein-disulfide isomerase [Vibrio sp. 10N.261.55.A7]
MKLKIVTAIVSALLVSPMALAQSQSEKLEEINAMLESNPTLIDGLHSSLVAYLSEQSVFEQALKENHDYIYNNPNHSSFGAAEPAITIVNVSDYSCPWCKKLDPVLYELVDKYPEKIKVVNLLVPLKELPSKLNSTTYALNVWQQQPEKYQQVHDMLISKPGSHNEVSVFKVAQRTGTEKQYNEDKLTTEMMATNFNLMKDLGIRGTPAMLIGDELVSGYLPLEKLEAMLKQNGSLN